MGIEHRFAVNISVSEDDVYARYAAALGVAVEFLTYEDKAMALCDAVIAEAAKAVDRYVRGPDDAQS